MHVKLALLKHTNFYFEMLKSAESPSSPHGGAAPANAAMRAKGMMNQTGQFEAPRSV